jgi:Spy/CpxP family protein refolding chaperone
MRPNGLARLALIAAVGFNPWSAQADGNETPPARTQPAEDQASAELTGHHRHHHRGGVTQFVAMSLDTLGADDAKRSEVEKVQRDLQACMEQAGRREKELHLTLADGIAAGKIDKAKVEKTIAHLDAAATAVHECSSGGLNQLHAILSSPERWELVEKVQAHWDVWRQVDHEAAAGGRGPGGWIAELEDELTLTPGQVERISKAVPRALAASSARFDRKKVEASVQALAAAFVQDSFDARSIPASANAHLATRGAKRMAIFYETVTPILTPEQRATLAEHLREHAAHQPVIAER